MATSIGSDHAAPGSRRGLSPCEYAYDATGLLAGSVIPGETRMHFWRGNRVVNELRTSTRGSSKLTWLCAVGQPIIEQVSGAVARTTLLATAISGSVLHEVDSAVRTVAYAPHGSRPAGDGAGSAKAEPAFNGEPLDAASGCYLLGARHHRPYSPTLGMFLAPDSASPFGAGGLNTLSYCAGDPINRTDPTGHFWKWIFAGIAVVAAVATLGVMAFAGVAALTASAVVGAAAITVGAGLEVASAVVTDEKLSMILGIAGGVLGLAGGVAAGAAIAKGAANIKAKVAKFGQRLGSVRTQRASSTVMEVGSTALPPVSPYSQRRTMLWRQRARKDSDFLTIESLSRRDSTTSFGSKGSTRSIRSDPGPRQNIDRPIPDWSARNHKDAMARRVGMTTEAGSDSAPSLDVNDLLRKSELPDAEWSGPLSSGARRLASARPSRNDLASTRAPRDPSIGFS